MIKNKKVLAVVPARGGSKGVPLKNIKKLRGLPLIAYIAPLVKEIPEIDRCVVSTDHAHIAKVAREAGLVVPFLRPQEISGDAIGDWDVLHHALLEMEKMDRCQYDIVLMLQPTSPLRTSKQIREVMKTLLERNFDSVWTVSQADLKFHPLKALVVEGGQLDLYDKKGKDVIARQQLKPVYFRNGVAYAMTRECIEVQRTILGKNAGAVVIKEPIANIDSLEDFERLEGMLKD